MSNGSLPRLSFYEVYDVAGEPCAGGIVSSSGSAIRAPLNHRHLMALLTTVANAHNAVADRVEKLERDVQLLAHRAHELERGFAIRGPITAGQLTEFSENVLELQRVVQAGIAARTLVAMEGEDG